MSSVFSSVLRRTLRSSVITSSVLHRQGRSFFTSPYSTNCSLLQKVAQSPSKPSIFFSGFATSSKQGSADQRIKRALEEEIGRLQESGDLGMECTLPGGFPFKIIDITGDEIITLKRDFSGENIEIEVPLPTFQDEEEEGSNEDESQDEDKGYVEQTTVPLIVKISKGKDPHLVFCCTGYQDDLTIDELLIKHQETSSNKIPYEGPKFLDLAEELHKAFYKYLDERGINGSLIHFLRDYMMAKDNKEYLAWLKNVKGFIGK
ncbi:hypothetical protein H6P81_001119 [Aristolochia fimbriata]|uniref:Mitochondrial glycoprotein n=1 Tax=Aristolochia fimbriata TaxID=158543 RepID=A0AAV7F960_ARIFI|nr:hypothetical protein H6P81_001119 [Aristolochia fimbriata]